MHMDSSPTAPCQSGLDPTQARCVSSVAVAVSHDPSSGNLRGDIERAKEGMLRPEQGHTGIVAAILPAPSPFCESCARGMVCHKREVCFDEPRLPRWMVRWHHRGRLEWPWPAGVTRRT